ncbi:MAG: PEP-CTERM sorting domain-containing protein [Halopseudomonas sp.]
MQKYLVKNNLSNPTIRALLTALLLITLPLNAYASLIIQEVLYDGDGSDSDDAFTELFGTPGMDLVGWQLIGINGRNGDIYRSLNLSGAVVPADGILLIATADANLLVATQRDWIANVDWQNGPDAIQLWNPLGDIIDALQYGDATLFNAGNGNPTADISAGWSLNRTANNGDNLSDFSAQQIPTPGAMANTIPEPSSVLLVGAALIVMRIRRNG